VVGRALTAVDVFVVAVDVLGVAVDVAAIPAPLAGASSHFSKAFATPPICTIAPA